MLNNGTVDLDHFKGYVRIPLEYMCSETPSEVTDSNTEFGVNKPTVDGVKIYDSWALTGNKTEERAKSIITTQSNCLKG